VPSIEPLHEPACIVRDGGGTLATFHMPLRYAGLPFAAVRGKVDRIEARLARGDKGGTVTVSVDGTTMTGEVSVSSPRDLHVAPRVRSPIDGWLTIERALVTSVADDGTLSTVYMLPFELQAAEPKYAPACADVTLLEAPASPLGAVHLAARPVNTSLRLAPGGRTVATVVTPAPPKVEPGVAVLGLVYSLEVLERKGQDARVRFSNPDVSAEGWVAASAVGAVYAPSRGGVRVQDPVRTDPPLRCDREVAFFVRHEGKTLRVGVASRGAAILPAGPAENGETPVDLGLGPKKGYWGRAYDPFALAKDLEDCSRGR
jgi:hypothetical protein